MKGLFKYIHMIDKDRYNENIHSRNNDDIVERLNISSVMLSLAILLIGCACFVFVWSSGNASSTINMLLMVCGTAFILFSIFRLFWKTKEWVYLPTGSCTKEGTCFFDSEELDDLNEEIVEKNFENRKKHHKLKQSGNVKMDYIISEDKRFVATQLFKFVPYNYVEASDIYYLNGEDAEKFAQCLIKKEF